MAKVSADCEKSDEHGWRQNRRCATHRLMDGADDGETGSRQPPQELDDPQRALRVQSCSRFVAEEDGRSTDDLDRNSRPLPLLGVESSGRRSDDGILDRGEVEKIQYDVDVGEFGLARDGGILTQEGGELESFTDRRAVVCGEQR